MLLCILFTLIKKSFLLHTIALRELYFFYMYHLLIFLLDILMIFCDIGAFESLKELLFCAASHVFETLNPCPICLFTLCTILSLKCWYGSFWYVFTGLGIKKKRRGGIPRYISSSFLLLNSCLFYFGTFDKNIIRKISKENRFIEEMRGDTDYVTQHGLPIQFYFSAQLLPMFAEKNTSPKWC